MRFNLAPRPHILSAVAPAKEAGLANRDLQVASACVRFPALQYQMNAFCPAAHGRTINRVRFHISRDHGGISTPSIAVKRILILVGCRAADLIHGREKIGSVMV